MYESFFHLKENPFGLTPDPRFFFHSRGHREALAYLAYGVFNKKGFLALTGEVGLGKTTVVRTFVRTFHPCLEAAFVLNTKLSFEEMLYMILKDYGCEPDGQSKMEMISTLNEYLIERYAHNQNPVLIIDEAQNLSCEILEELRMLSNLETDREKLIQIVLVGQPELEAMMARRELRQLRQRIPIIHRIKPLSAEEVSAYINHRLRVAGMENDGLDFTQGAKDCIYRYAEGIPRLVNMLCDRVLLHGYLRKTHCIDSPLVEAIVREMLGCQGGESASGGLA